MYYLAARSIPAPGPAFADELPERMERADRAGPAVRWVRSYWVESTNDLLCLFAADEAGEVVAHAAQAGLPAGDVQAARPVDPREYEQLLGMTLPVISGGTTYLVRRPLPPGHSDDDADGAALRAIHGAIEFGPVEWIRSYWIDGEFMCLYRSTDPDTLVEHAERCQLPLQPPILPATEIAPASAASH